jgi:hypothetical protein
MFDRPRKAHVQTLHETNFISTGVSERFLSAAMAAIDIAYRIVPLRITKRGGAFSRDSFETIN